MNRTRPRTALRALGIVLLAMVLAVLVRRVIPGALQTRIVRVTFYPAVVTPVTDGMEATRRIRALEGGRDVKIVATSASGFRREREQVLTAGADGLVPKPIQFGHVYDSLSRRLGVRFVSDEPMPGAGAPSADVDRAALTALPSSLRTEPAHALVSLDAARIAASIRRVAEFGPRAGRRAGASREPVSLHHHPARARQACRDGVSNEGTTA